MKQVFLITFLLLSLQTINSQAKSLHAHEHGSSELHIVLDSNILEVEIHGPADDFVGFEHVPQTTKEKEKASLAYKNLQDLKNMLLLPADAQCSIKQVNFEEGEIFRGLAPNLPLVPATSKDAANIKSADHDDVMVRYSGECTSWKTSSVLKLNIFSSFKDIKKLAVLAVINGKQSSATLNPHQKILEL